MIKISTVNRLGNTFQIEAKIQDNGGEAPFRYGFEISENLLIVNDPSKKELFPEIRFWELLNLVPRSTA